MTSSSDRRHGAADRFRQSGQRLPVLLLTAALLASAPAAPVLAQADSVGEPVQLGPVEEGTPQTSADSADGGATQVQDERLPGEGVEGIEVDRLDAPDAETIGPLDTDNGGLGIDMWAGTPRHVVEGLLPRLPGMLRGPALRDLAHRLLLSAASPPVRQQTGSHGSNLLAMRVERLVALGAVEQMNALIRVLPRSVETPGIERRRVEGLFLVRQRDKACQLTRNAVADSDAVFWQKALAVCQLAAGEIDQASLTVSLLREQGHDDDRTFLRLVDAVEQGLSELPDDLQEPVAELNPLQLALIEAGGLAVPAERLADADARVLTALAHSQTLGLETRARAAEQAAAIGALKADFLAKIYQQFDFTADRLTQAASLTSEQQAASMAPERRRAMLYQAIRSESAPAVQAELLRQALTGDDDGERLRPGLFLALAKLLGPELSSLEVQPDLAWFAETAGRALYAAGRPEAAGAWLRMAQQEAIINPRAAAAVTALWPYARLSGAQEVPANGGLGVWRQARDGADDAPLAAQQSLLRAALDALGSAPDRSWVEIALDGPMERRPAPPTALLYALEEAGAAGRRGEAALLALIVLGQATPENCHPAALGKALTALSQVGLEDAARRIAVEVAVYNGI